jgi:alkanesulfonate monooxygenase SsuD/methylene tetrahydromethanopterin reductase-like flavin-dependent oxidoreductase (luciferase family)
MPTFGMFTFPTEYLMQPADVAQAIEERALDAFYVCEHTHIPTSKQSRKRQCYLIEGEKEGKR